jgi:hypothetical protein
MSRCYYGSPGASLRQASHKRADAPCSTENSLLNQMGLAIRAAGLPDGSRMGREVHALVLRETGGAIPPASSTGPPLKPLRSNNSYAD